MRQPAYIEYLETVVLSLLEAGGYGEFDEIKCTDKLPSPANGCMFSIYNIRETIEKHRECRKDANKN